MTPTWEVSGIPMNISSHEKMARAKATSRFILSRDQKVARIDNLEALAEDVKIGFQKSREDAGFPVSDQKRAIPV